MFEALRVERDPVSQQKRDQSFLMDNALFKSASCFGAKQLAGIHRISRN
jgi:hypothetical protein